MFTNLNFKMKYFYTILAIALIGLLIYVLWPRETVVIDNSKVKELQTNLQRAEKKRTEIIVKAREDSAKQAVITKAKDAEIARLKVASRKYRQANVRIDTVLLKEPEVGNYAAFLDSIVVAQDSQIAELKEQKVEQWNNFNNLITASDSTFKANQELNNYYLETERKANKQLRRSNNLLKVGIVAVPLGVIGVLALTK